MYFVPELPDIEVLWARQRPIVTAMLVLSVLGTAWHVLILLAWVFVFGLAGQIAGIVATSMYVCNCGASHVTGPIRSMRAALTASLALTGVSAVLSFYIVVGERGDGMCCSLMPSATFARRRQLDHVPPSAVACVIGDIGLGILSVLHIVGYGIFLYLGVGVWKAATRVIRELPTGMQVRSRLWPLQCGLLAIAAMPVMRGIRASQNIVVNVPRQYELREAAPTTNGIPIAAGVPVRLGQDAA